MTPEREKQLVWAIDSLYGWTMGGACSDCTMFREAPSCQTYVHEEGCAHLETINKALALIGRELEVGHRFHDADAVISFMARERRDACGHYVVKAGDLYLAPGRRGERFRWTKFERFAVDFIGERAASQFASTITRDGAASSAHVRSRTPRRKPIKLDDHDIAEIARYKQSRLRSP